MSRIQGPWSHWDLIDNDPANPNLYQPVWLQPEQRDLICILIDHAIDDWKRERQMSTEEQEWLAGGGGPPSFSFAADGAVAYGKVLAFELVQERDFHTKGLLTWDDGRPRMQGCYTMQAMGVEPTDEDNGQRRLFVKLAMREAIQAAIKESGHKGASLIGGMLWVKHDGYKSSEKNPTNPPKKYKARYQPPSAADELDAIQGPDLEEYRSTPGVVPEVRTVPVPPEFDQYSEEPF